MQTRALSMAALVGGALAVGPQLASRRPVRVRWRPALAGLGTAGHVALTFDDGPDPTSTPAVLAALDRLGWSATFFMLGCMVERAPGLAAEVAAAGHEVAVHGYHHRSHLRSTPAAIHHDTARATEVVAAVAGVAPRWYRPPYGSMSWATSRAAHRAGLDVVLWSSWGRDWSARATPGNVTRAVERGLGPGATVLLHDSDCTSAPGSWRTTVASLSPLASLLDDRGLTVGPLSGHEPLRRRRAR